MIPANSPLVRALSPYSLSDPVVGSTVTFSFERAGSIIDTREFTGGNSRTIDWTNAEKNVVRDTFDYIETIVDLEFDERSFGSSTIEFWQVSTLAGGATGFAEPTGVGQSLIVLPTDYIFPISYGYDNVTVIHEIGHALGLSHPFDGDARLPGVVSPYDFGAHDVNSELATRMSYIPGYTATYPELDIYGEPYSFGAVDIAALQLLYGANTSTGLGNTTYTGRAGELITIWDNGGTDTIDFSRAIDKVYIDLRAATLEDVPDGGGYLSFIDIADGTIADGGYTIAYGVEIENAFGGAGHDRLGGNVVGNAFTGGKGNDRIDGRAGFDTARYSGDKDSYTLKLSAQGTTLADRRADRDGTDTLISIEALEFGGAEDAFELARFNGASTLTQAQLDSVIELYIAYFNRAPASTGFNYWATELSKGYSLPEMAASFFVQPETQRTYAELFRADGSLNDVTGFVKAAFVNVLGREARPEGLSYWVNELENNSEITPPIFILALINGAKASTGSGNGITADQQYLAIKADIGLYYAGIKGLSDAQNAAEVMAQFDGTSQSVLAAKSMTDDLYADALDAQSGEFLFQLVGVVDDPFASFIG
ncbi:Peptidase S8 and S53 subtilisin kexin sedolisin [Sulfitobacter noctilucicola]|uniref:Peptidase M10 serralysin C-terminal domain-containing protein n=1 Tax=Sulfitobacter noctilucicola TaxID=1342301 RepID=A0A7W6M5V6_9RHOB|nr:M10 family metallopeptidase C-terminal domain-containing protein [Sulfitobacter noctilucicola]KIN62470.1 Peptidase S8 and S53 subtilisin kexin sedolisin [Sulfitobacter noctilucicola]MBB4172999.1 hypothetical protein [Sulfitobacter noctilucicola]